MPRTPASDSTTPQTTRRQFFDQAAGAASLAGIALTQSAVVARAEDAPAATPAPAVHAGGSDELRVALIGCGGRGGGAAATP
ncbi:MAG: gfo/Idh/MocA family oxidoreductase, partial [Planctomycetota bacterium]